MARQADRLIRVGLDGFRDIEEQFGRAKRPVMKVPNEPCYYQVHQVPAIKVIDSNEAAKRYGGKVYMDYHANTKGKPVQYRV